MLAMNAPERWGDYLVVKAFRYAVRDYTPGDIFYTRRVDPHLYRLNELYREGFLSLQDEEADKKYREERQFAMDMQSDPKPSSFKKVLKDLFDFNK